MKKSRIKQFWLAIVLMAHAMPASAVVVTESQKLTSSPSVAGAFFGRSSAISGNTAIIGAFEEGAGAAYVFERDNTGIWNQVVRLAAYGASPGDGFGFSVALDGDLALIGGRGVNFTGGAWSFERNSLGQWAPAGKLPAVGLVAGDFFGVDVAISGDVALVGANHDEDRGTDAGAAYFFHRNSLGGWTQTDTVFGNDTNSRDFFGESVAIDGDTAVIGGFGHEAAYVFQPSSSGNWEQVARLQAGDLSREKRFGLDVSVDGSTIGVGAHYDNQQTGAVYVFEEEPTNSWAQVAKLTAPDAAFGRGFGESVAVSGNLLVAGSIGDDSLAGAAHVFAEGSSGWQLASTLHASDRAPEDLFFRVSLDGKTAIVGAWRDDHGGLFDAGSAYVFENIPEPATSRLVIWALASAVLGPFRRCGSFTRRIRVF